MTVEVKMMLGGARTGAALLGFGAVCSIVTSAAGVCPIRANLAYALAGILALTAVGVARGQQWARVTGRGVAWLSAFLYAMLVVPDWDDAVFEGATELHATCGILAAYFVLCALALGFGRGKSVSSAEDQGAR